MTAILTGDQAGLILAQPGGDGAFPPARPSWRGPWGQAAAGDAGLPAGEKRYRDAFAAVWNMRASLRFNQGRAGRGGEYFTAAHRERIARTLGYYDVPKTRLADLV